MTQAPRPGRNSPQRGKGGRPAGQKPAGKSFGGNKPAGKSFGGQRPGGKSFGGNKPAGQKPAGKTFGGNKPAGKSFGGQRPGGQASNKPASNKPVGNKPVGKKPAGRNFADKKPAANKSAGQARRVRGPAAFGKERFGQNLGPVASGAERGRDAGEVHDPAGERLQKVLANAGVASRRECEVMIAHGRVEVDDQIVTELGVKVDPASTIIRVDGIRVQPDHSNTYLAFNKPRGVVSTMEDPEGRPCISDYLRKKNERLFHVGRLDAGTEGLLLLTNDGELANRLTHPKYEVPKTYLVQVRGPMPHGVGAQMREGIELEDGMTRVDSFKLVDSTPGKVLVEVSLHSGRNRVVRRLFAAAGHPVIRLVRVQMGPIKLNNQKQGSVRNLGHQEVGHLLASVGM